MTKHEQIVEWLKTADSSDVIGVVCKLEGSDIYEMSELDDVLEGLSPYEILDQLEDGFMLEDEYLQYSWGSIRSMNEQETIIEIKENADEYADAIENEGVLEYIPNELEEILND